MAKRKPPKSSAKAEAKAETGTLPCPDIFSEAQWRLFFTVLKPIDAMGLRYCLGGGFAVACYTGRKRRTKDLDLFIRHDDRDAMVEVTRKAGFTDLHDREPYDRNWIYRAVHDGSIVDLIWQMANHRAPVTDDWLNRAPAVEVLDHTFHVLPLEELLWMKLYVLQRERCDWPDVMNLLHAGGATMDWDHLIRVMGGDTRILASALNLFAWMCPKQALAFPRHIWSRLGLQPPIESINCDTDRRRVRLLDSRPWFGPDTSH